MGREVAERLVWEEKVRRYPAVADAAHAVRYLPVWPWPPPKEGELPPPDPVYVELERLARATSFFAPQQVNTTLGGLLTAAAGVIDRIRAIRGSTQPGLAGRIDERYRADYTDVITALDDAITNYTRAARVDLAITEDFWPIAVG